MNGDTRLPLVRRAVFVLVVLALPAHAYGQGPPPVPDSIGPRSGWRQLAGEWTDGCTYFADLDEDGLIDYRRVAVPCGSFNHLIWFDRDGDGFFDAEDTGGDPVAVPVLGDPIMAVGPDATVPCFGSWPEPTRPHRLARPLTSTLLTENEFRHASLVYPALPVEGYLIRFYRDGAVESENFPADVHWRIDGEHTLLIETDAGGHPYTYDARCGTLLREVPFGDGRVSMEIRLVENGD